MSMFLIETLNSQYTLSSYNHANQTALISNFLQRGLYWINFTLQLGDPVPRES